MSASDKSDPAAGGADSNAASTSADSAAAPASAATGDLFKAGVTVKDANGATIGKITQVVGDTSGQASSVVVDSGGVPINVSASSLSAQGDYLVTSQTKSDHGAKTAAQ